MQRNTCADDAGEWNFVIHENISQNAHARQRTAAHGADISFVTTSRGRISPPRTVMRPGPVSICYSRIRNFSMTLASGWDSHPGVPAPIVIAPATRNVPASMRSE